VAVFIEVADLGEHDLGHARPAASIVSSGSTYSEATIEITFSTCSASGVGCRTLRSCGSRTRSSRAGFGSTPAKSSTWLSTVFVFLSVSRLYSAACSFATRSVTSAKVIASTRFDRREGATFQMRPSAERCMFRVCSGTSIRLTRQASEAAPSVNAFFAEWAARTLMSGTRRQASSCSITRRRATASALRRKIPP
jgi:hypothetical protein